MPKPELSVLVQHLIETTVAMQKKDEKLFLHAFSELHKVCEHLKSEDAEQILQILPTNSEVKRMDWTLRHAVVNHLQEFA